MQRVERRHLEAQHVRNLGVGSGRLAPVPAVVGGGGCEWRALACLRVCVC